jgi:hypothetical protein
MQGGPHPAIRSDDRRTLRTEAAKNDVAERVLRHVAGLGRFQPKLTTLEFVASRGKSTINRLWGNKHLLLRHLARTEPRRIVDAIGLSPEARVSLSPRDEKALAFAVLAGVRLERGE